MMSGSPPGAKLTNQGVLQWRPQSTVKEKFYFKATDECNASSTFEMSVEILTCPCTDKGVCLPDPNHPRGSGMYYCKCQPGYDGQRCEREIDECLSNPCVHGRFKHSACYSIPLKFHSFTTAAFTILMVGRNVSVEIIRNISFRLKIKPVIDTWLQPLSFNTCYQPFTDMIHLLTKSYS